MCIFTIDHGVDIIYLRLNKTPFIAFILGCSDKLAWRELKTRRINQMHFIAMKMWPQLKHGIFCNAVWGVNDTYCNKSDANIETIGWPEAQKKCLAFRQKLVRVSAGWYKFVLSSNKPLQSVHKKCIFGDWWQWNFFHYIFKLILVQWIDKIDWKDFLWIFMSLRCIIVDYKNMTML